MILVIATIEVYPGRRDDFLREFRRIVPAVRAEKGCIEYGPLVDLPTNISAQPPQRKDVVTVVEKWGNVEALETHLVAPHMLKHKKAVKDIAKQTTIQVLEPV